jgi:hypothetical protein
MIPNPQQFEAAAEFVQTIISRLANDRGVHAETAVSAAARMAGTFVLRSCGLPLAQLPAGSPVFSDRIDDRGGEVLGRIGEALAAMNVPFDARKLTYDVPEGNTPQIDLEQTQAMFAAAYADIQVRRGLDDGQAAHAAAVSVAILIHKCAGVLDPHLAYTIATYGMVEASKTVPYHEPAQVVLDHG